jgi:hypothetical protein
MRRQVDVSRSHSLWLRAVGDASTLTPPMSLESVTIGIFAAIIVGISIAGCTDSVRRRERINVAFVATRSRDCYSYFK